MRVVIAFSCGLFILVATTAVKAWNQPGHMTSAEIAYDDLKERNPTVLAKVLQVLRKHPYFETKWQDKLGEVPQDDRDLRLFILAATWPDDIRRKDFQYDRPEWHFVNIIYRPGESEVTIPDGESIIKAFPENRSIAKSTTADQAARAVAVCWMLHLIGDIHQPLHTVKLVTQQFPEPVGDRGGTRFYVRVTTSSSTVSLHQIWDGLIIGSYKFQAVRNKALTLRSKPGLKREDLAEQLAVKSFNEWALGSYIIAVEQVYRKGALQGSTRKDDGAVLPSGYTAKAKEVAERQIVLSGYRMSEAMVDVFGQ